MNNPSNIDTHLLKEIERLSTAPFDTASACDRLTEINRLVKRELEMADLLDALSLLGKPVVVNLSATQWYKPEDFKDVPK